jgi:hypothetical protein
MADWVMPAALAQPMPRKVSMNGWSGVAVILIAILVGVTVSLMLAVTAVRSHKISVLEQRGVETTGHVSGVRITYGRNSRSYIVDYNFEPVELSHQAVTFEGGESEVSADVYNADLYFAVRDGRPVAVIYDPDMPDRSMLMAEFNVAKAHNIWLLVGPACAVIGGPTLAFSLLFAIRYRREKYVLQWGNAAPAKIIGEDKTATRSGWVAVVRYRFEDDKGVARENTTSLPVRNDPRPDFTDERARYLGNPTAVFDPRNSERNVLFPGTLLQLDG